MKLILFLADGFEEIEALTPVDYLRRVDVTIDTVSITNEKEVRGAHNIRVIADKTIDDLEDLEAYDGVIIPGGIPGATNLRDNPRVIGLVQKMNNQGKLASAICAGPIVLEKAGILGGKKLTSHPGFSQEFKDYDYQEDNVVVDGNIITSRGPALAVDFTIEIARFLLGDQAVEKIKKSILYNK